MTAHACEDVEQEQFSSDGDIANFTVTLKINVFFSENWALINKTQLYLGTYPKEVPPSHRNTCLTMLIADTYIMIRNWK